MRIAVVATDRGALARLERVQSEADEIVVIAPPHAQPSLGRFGGEARWIGDDAEIAAPTAALGDAVAARDTLLCVLGERRVDELWCDAGNGAGWAIALDARQRGALQSVRVVIEVDGAVGDLARPLAIGDTVETALTREAARQALRDADEVRGDPAALDVLRGAGWTLGSARDPAAWTIDDSPPISVIVPHKDLAEYLPACLESIRKQSVPVDIVLVDDGSGPAGLECVDAEARRNPAMKVIRQANTGLGGARNAGAEAATSPLILFVDADNLLRPRCAEVLREALRRRPRATYAAPAFRAFDDATGDTVRLYCPAELSPRTLFLENTAGDACAMHRRDAFLAAGGFTHERLTVEDWDFWLKCAERGGSGAVVAEALFDYRVREKSMLRSQCRLDRLQAPFLLASRHPSLLSTCAEDVAALAPGHVERLLEHAEWTARQPLNEECSRLRKQAAGASLREQQALDQVRALERRLAACEGEVRLRDAAIAEMASSTAVRTARLLKTASPALHRLVGRVASSIVPGRDHR